MRWFFHIWIGILFPIQMIQGDTIRKDYCVMNGEAEREAEKEIEEKYGLSFSVSGGGAITVVRSIIKSVEIDVPLSMKEGRRLLVDCVQILLKHIDGYRPLRPFLFEYPFPLERIRFSIDISPESKKKMSPNAPTIFSLLKGKIYYYKSPPNDEISPLIDIHNETYLDALKILTQEDQNNGSPIRLSFSRNNIENKNNSFLQELMIEGEIQASEELPRYIGPQEESDMMWHLDGYANKIAKKYAMEFHRVGSFSDDHEETYSLMFFNFHQMSLEQGKKFAVELVHDFLRELRTSPVIKKYNAYRNSFYKNWRYPPLLSEEPIPEQMGLKIGFWDKNFDRPKKPYLAEIVFLHGSFYYYEADPVTQARKLILQQRFEDATRNTDQAP